MKSVSSISFISCVAVAAMLLIVPSAQAATSDTVTLADGVTQETTYKIHLQPITSGQNKIRNKAVVGSERPAVDGWITKFVPNLVYTSDGTIPSSSKVMFHHGVWFNTSAGGGAFFATGEEKTQMVLPDGYGYEYKTSDGWMLNEMIHNLTPQPMDLTVTYTIDFIPKTAPEAASIKKAEPIWMDVENGSNRGYPVFDVLRDSGGADGEFSYPQDDPNAYSPGVHKNEWTAPRAGVLLGTTGHVHTGGLSTELFMRRAGASYTGTACEQPANYDAEFDRVTAIIDKTTVNQTKIKSLLKTKAIKKLKASMKPKKMKRLKKSMKPAKFSKMKRQKTRRLKRLKKVNAGKLADLKKVSDRKKQAVADQAEIQAKADAAQQAYDDCTASIPTVEGNRVRLFESTAHYFEPAGPVSWDMAMVSTKPDWRVQVKPGDKLDLQANYETDIGSWYESMGINVVFWSNETNGRDPYKVKVDTPGVLNHGHYPENDDHGGAGAADLVGPDPSTLADGLPFSTPITVGNGYQYSSGGFNLPDANGRPPVIEQGDQFSFQLASADATNQIWHSLTSCKSPCNKSTGIAYPLPDGDFQFDSGQLGNLNGNGAPPTVGRTTWSTPANLPVGTHTYFCRIHPLMRGAFRVKPKS